MKDAISNTHNRVLDDEYIKGEQLFAIQRNIP
jgi:hypothetical protein